MRRRTSSGRRAVDAPSPVPAVLPLVVFEAQDGDRLVVIVDGDKLAAAPVHRSEIGRVLTELVTKLAVPTRVELHELDGTVLADIVQPPPLEPDPDPEELPAEPTARGLPGMVDVHAEGFVAGEEIAVAVAVRHDCADADGQVLVRLDPAELPGPEAVEIVLVGRGSGTTAFRSLT